MSETQNEKMNNQSVRIYLPVVFVLLLVLALLSALILSFPLSSFYRDTETRYRVTESRMLESSILLDNRVHEEILGNRDRNLNAVMQYLLHVQQKNEWTAEELKKNADNLGIGVFELIETEKSAAEYAASTEIPEGWKFYYAKPDTGHILILKDNLTAVAALQGNIQAVLRSCTETGGDEPVFLDAFAVDRKNNTVITAEGTMTLDQTDRMIPSAFEEHEYDGRTYGLSREADGSVIMHHYDGSSDIDLYTVYSEDDSTRTANSVNLFVMIIFLCAVISYVIYIFYIRQFKTQYPADEEYSVKTINYRTILSIVFTVSATLIAAVYAQCFYSAAAFSMYDRNLISEAKRITAATNENADLLREYSRQDHLKTASIIAGHLSDGSQNPDSSELNKIKNMFGFDYIVLYDQHGTERFSDGSVWNVSFAADPEDPAFAMNDLRFGSSGVFVDPYYNAYTGRKNARAAVPVKSTDPSLSGFLETGINESKTDMVFKPDMIYQEITASVPKTTAAVYFIDQISETITNASLRQFENMPAEPLGFIEESLKPGYFNTLIINGNSSYVSTGTVPGRIMSVVMNADILRGMDGSYIIGITGLSLLVCAVLLYIMRLDRKKIAVYETGWISRIESSSIKLKKKTGIIVRPEDRIGHLFRLLLILGIASMIVTLQSQLLFHRGNPLFTEIMQSGWNKGLNIFALTSNIILVEWACLIVFVSRRVLARIGQMGSLHVETVTRLLRSAIRYIAVVVVCYMVMLNFGLNPEALATSAGLIGIAVGIGARDLITDIVAGMFIIFERDYEVGDIVEVSGFTGRVHEIGMRVTTLTDITGDEKIINNRNMVNIIKSSTLPERITIKFRVPYNTDIKALNDILEKESPLIMEKYPDLSSAPHFTGILEFEEDMIQCGFFATCPEAKKIRVTPMLRYELKRILDENNIPMQRELEIRDNSNEEQ